MFVSTGLFFVNITEDKTCDLLLGEKSLDYEKKNEYNLKLRLDSLADYINQNKSVTMVRKCILLNFLLTGIGLWQLADFAKRNCQLLDKTSFSQLNGNRVS